VIARGTQGVFEFVKATIVCGGAVSLRGEVFAMNCYDIDLKSRNLNEAELLPLFESIREGKFSRLRILNLEGNGIGDAGASLIGEGLKANSSLHELHLNNQSSGPFKFPGSSSLMRGMDMWFGGRSRCRPARSVSVMRNSANGIGSHVCRIRS
jgi:hypothetical protein